MQTCGGCLCQHGGLQVEATGMPAQLSTMLDEKTERWLELADVAEAAGQLAAR